MIPWWFMVRGRGRLTHLFIGIHLDMYLAQRPLALALDILSEQHFGRTTIGPAEGSPLTCLVIINSIAPISPPTPWDFATGSLTLRIVESSGSITLLFANGMVAQQG